MKALNITTLMALTASIGSTASAIDSKVFSDVTEVYRLNKQKTEFTCGEGFYGYSGEGNLDFLQAEKKSFEEVKAKYPDYPWHKIQIVADQLYDADLAIAAGTTCTETLYVTNQISLANVAASYNECKDLAVSAEPMDLEACLKSLACKNIGRQSAVCKE